MTNTITYTRLNDEIISKWKKLWNETDSASIFSSYEWFCVCIDTYDIKSFKVFALYEDDSLKGIYPTVPIQAHGIKLLSSFLLETAVDSALLREDLDESKLKSFFDEILKSGNLCIPRVADEMATTFSKIYPNSLISAISINSYLKVDSDPMHYFSSRVRQSMRSIARKNKEDLSYRRYTTDLEKHFETVVSIEQNSSKKMQSKDIFSQKENTSQFENIIKYFSDKVSISFVYHKEKPIAYMFNVFYKGTLLEVHTAYLADFYYLSPGKLLLYFLLEDLKAQEEINTFKFCFELNGLHPEFEMNFDVYLSDNKLVLYWLEFVNLARRINQVLLCRKIFPDSKFLFKTLKNSNIEKIIESIKEYGTWRR